MMRSGGRRTVSDIKFRMMDVEFPCFGLRFSVVINGSDQILRWRPSSAETAEILSPEDRRSRQSPTLRYWSNLLNLVLPNHQPRCDSVEERGQMNSLREKCL